MLLVAEAVERLYALRATAAKPARDRSGEQGAGGPTSAISDRISAGPISQAWACIQFPTECGIFWDWSALYQREVCTCTRIYVYVYGVHSTSGRHRAARQRNPSPNPDPNPNPNPRHRAARGRVIRPMPSRRPSPTSSSGLRIRRRQSCCSLKSRLPPAPTTTRLGGRSTKPPSAGCSRRVGLTCGLRSLTSATRPIGTKPPL